MNFANRILSSSWFGTPPSNSKSKMKGADHYRNAPRDIRKCTPGQKMYDFFRNNFASAKDLERNGKKELELMLKRKNNYDLTEADIDKKELEYVLDLALGDMLADTPEDQRDY